MVRVQRSESRKEIELSHSALRFKAARVGSNRGTCHKTERIQVGKTACAQINVRVLCCKNGRVDSFIEGDKLPFWEGIDLCNVLLGNEFFGFENLKQLVHEPDCTASPPMQDATGSEPGCSFHGHVVNDCFQVAFRIFEDFELAVSSGAGAQNLADAVDGFAAA